VEAGEVGRYGVSIELLAWSPVRSCFHWSQSKHTDGELTRM
ncbi:hypothetical protein MTO96_035519, partial [Rhipicephalus appendiculatus]